VKIRLQLFFLGRRVGSVPLHKADGTHSVEDEKEANHSIDGTF
jgi:hypothetical protein